ncbi:hypothetical protein BN7_3697 [Wickerhamomyces ciferrii]|uniref:Uncharacterized protein n=1 Tax=Wickerhamomyces ciferrii (strain ATCC 14091 / BCRC 22168 / CBS 111 / JCM 3599 / NBRC 0793 / NRRL Y-1031 F-60-10) TaxID=1206466 RepID=K0KS27_WICCF|nr:uncharacterized protein BN7_3697 [Wickerhamomyces ciferrii]CCH44139.1 hypothetical protein BN7_3697 [Wickerhamomyces ciferrii]
MDTRYSVFEMPLKKSFLLQFSNAPGLGTNSIEIDAFTFNQIVPNLQLPLRTTEICLEVEYVKPDFDTFDELLNQSYKDKSSTWFHAMYSKFRVDFNEREKEMTKKYLKMRSQKHIINSNTDKFKMFFYQSLLSVQLINRESKRKNDGGNEESSKDDENLILKDHIEEDKGLENYEDPDPTDTIGNDNTKVIRTQKEKDERTSDTQSLRIQYPDIPFGGHSSPLLNIQLASPFGRAYT